MPKNIKTDLKKLVCTILESNRLEDIPNIKKLKGHPTAYRIRLGNYRIGIFVESEKIILSRVLHRKEVYRYFP